MLLETRAVSAPVREDCRLRCKELMALAAERHLPMAEVRDVQKATPLWMNEALARGR